MTNFITTDEWLDRNAYDDYEYWSGGSRKQYGSHIERPSYYDPFYGQYGDFIPGMDE